MAYYNVSPLNGSENVAEIFVAANTISDGLMTPVLLLVVFMIAIISLSNRYDIVTAMRVSGILTTMLAVGAWVTGLISMQIVFFPAIITAFSFILGAYLRELGGE